MPGPVKTWWQDQIQWIYFCWMWAHIAKMMLAPAATIQIDDDIRF